MSGFYNIVFQKWIHQSRKSQYVVPALEKSVPDPGEDFPRSELFALNLGHVYARWGKSVPNLGHDFFLRDLLMDLSWTSHGLLIDLSILPYEILYTFSIPLGLEQP